MTDILVIKLVPPILTKSKYRGIEIVSSAHLKAIDESNNLMLSISTSKERSIISVYINEDNDGYTVKKFAIFEDYMQTIRPTGIKRGTEKAIRQAHDIALTMLDNHLQAIKEQYKL